MSGASDVLPVEPTPWYRDRWPWFLMLGPAIVMIAGFATLWIALRSDDGLVADDYYKHGLAINQTLARAHRSADLRLAATVDVAGDGRARMTLDMRAAKPPIVRLRLVHPTRAGLDQSADLALGPDGVYRGHVGAIAAGRWLVVVETPEWRLGPVESGGDGVHLTLAAQTRP